MMLFAGLPDWTWGQAGGVALAGMVTALIIAILMILTMWLLELSTFRSGKKSITAVETGTKPAAGKGGETVPNQQVAAVIAAAVCSYLTDQTPSYKAGPFIAAGKPSTAASRSNWRFVGRKHQLESSSELIEQVGWRKQRSSRRFPGK
jgi:hypothetical protein